MLIHTYQCKKSCWSPVLENKNEFLHFKKSQLVPYTIDNCFFFFVVIKFDNKIYFYPIKWNIFIFFPCNIKLDIQD